MKFILEIMMNKLVLLAIPLAFSAQAAQETQQPEMITKKTFNSEYIQAANEVDTSKYCMYEDKLVARNVVVEMGGGVLMQCQNVNAFGGIVELQWEPYKQQ
ncbi:DUF1496 domain-containing protein [Vibrio maritimus]|jgi:hypothetical protein|nr:DUF1496 domain-containing protein [Vibrio mediterranei]MCG9790741.1 DUF1496 domain-containing protein [Vibrio mediterranei]